MRVSDYIAKRIAEFGVEHVFLVTGGGAMHLNDAFGRNKSLKYVACHHEQACAMAAESYYRMSGKLAAVNVTSGPGGTNAITGVLGAWLDSLAMIVISGQVKWETLVRSTGLPLRQLGDQEFDIVSMVKHTTKYAEMVTDPKTIRYHLERALHLATTGRPGPVWLDIPMNVQGAIINPDELKGYDPSEDAQEKPTTNIPAITQEIWQRLKASKRPVVFVGSGVRIGHAQEQLIEFLDKMGLPVVTAWNAHDLVWDDHPSYVGRPGTIGDRSGNFAVQNADFLLVLGSRLNIRQVSYNWKSFARKAFKVVVDIDSTELKKPTITPDLPIHADVRDVLAELLKTAPSTTALEHQEWLKWCLERKKKYPTVLPEYWQTKDAVNPYCFTDALFSELKENDLVVTGDGTACVVTFQAAKIKKGQRLYTNSGCASMGYDLPAAIGAAISTDSKKRIICLAGDGSIQMNLQELQTIVTHRLPIKIFVFNNQGYHSIRQTQGAYFPDNIVGCGVESGLGFPDFGKLANAYGIPFRRCVSHSELKAAIQATVCEEGPQICEVVLDLKQQFAPKLASRKLPDGQMVSPALEDLFPFLSREELKSNMVIPLEETDK
ncbi:thiamine pyrophosphate-binding protein [Bdellovibrionota bacterium FG-2]